MEPHKPVTTKQASTTVARLLQWKKRNDANREVKAQLQEDKRMEEEEHFLSTIKTLPLGQVQAAVLRNYRAANTLRWKKLVLQTLAEQQQLDEEEAEFGYTASKVFTFDLSGGEEVQNVVRSNNEPAKESSRSAEKQ
ncbi:hypothetical protein P3T76_003188 [Phytophthora citrophthora]|uniref:Uncharacterized protein n=1 Tax=Phytophthora citrophthora TaxID=4793 RepID=A0AAD9GX35_9STRA|nr:hypothetical protein P3T76_003188 [Phytophthora citrophthora]